MKRVMTIRRFEPHLLLLTALVSLVISGLHPYDRLIWLLEVLPVLIAAPVLIGTRRSFPLTPLLYRLILIHALILILGGHYTYSRVPLGFWLQDLLDLGRNHYDRLGHIAQGFIPAIAVREILLRLSPLRPGRWLFFIVTSVCLAFSALYEMVEWWIAVGADQAAEAFLAAQGDIWDTQWDMFMALTGAVISQLLLSQYHDRAVSRLEERC